MISVAKALVHAIFLFFIFVKELLPSSACESGGGFLKSKTEERWKNYFTYCLTR